jgi:hypothetical protein
MTPVCRVTHLRIIRTNLSGVGADAPILPAITRWQRHGLLCLARQLRDRALGAYTRPQNFFVDFRFRGLSDAK